MKKLIVWAVLATSLFVLAPPAHATEIIDRDTGYGYAEVGGWSRGYSTVAILARYNGSADVFFRVRCANGQTFRRSWDDGGPMFRFTLRVPQYSRCTYFGWIDTNGYVALILGVY